MTDIPTTIFQPTQKHMNLKKDLDKLLAKHAEKLTAQETLAVMSQMVGMLVAYQDQRTMTPAMAMAIVSANIEVGNQTVLLQLSKTEGRA